jgi:hypothetical protein
MLVVAPAAPPGDLHDMMLHLPGCVGSTSAIQRVACTALACRRWTTLRMLWPACWRSASSPTCRWTPRQTPTTSAPCASTPKSAPFSAPPAFTRLVTAQCLQQSAMFISRVGTARSCTENAVMLGQCTSVTARAVFATAPTLFCASVALAASATLMPQPPSYLSQLHTRLTDCSNTLVPQMCVCQLVQTCHFVAREPYCTCATVRGVSSRCSW